MTEQTLTMSLFLKRNSAALYPPRIACYVCGAEVPSDYPLYPEPPTGCDLLLHNSTPHFPFLLHHPYCTERLSFLHLFSVAETPMEI